MRKITRFEGVAVPLILNNIDTDSIIPSVEMKRVSRQGLSDGLFANWRYKDRLARIPKPGFVLNKTAYQGASILLSGKNFGCGSSREHATWALAEFGIRAIIAPSFGTIFKNNCIANGILPVSLPTEIIGQLLAFVEQDPQKNRLTINLQQRTVGLSPEQVYPFKIEDSFAEMLLNGWAPITLTLRLESQISSFRHADKLARPWVYLA